MSATRNSAGRDSAGPETVGGASLEREGHGSAPGKAILLGEHFVVHGVPALALPLRSLTVEVRLRTLEAAPAETPAPDLAREHVAACLRVCHAHLGGPTPATVVADVRGSLPPSAGLGSSAALAVAVARAWCALCGAVPDEDRIRSVADACEALAHGRPSGIDVATVTASGPLRFRRGEPPTALRIGPGLGLLVLDTGTTGRTAATVARVAAWREAHPAGWSERADAAGEQVAAGVSALAAGDAPALGAAMDAVHALLAGLGVSTPALDATVAAARAAGATGAKLTGGGGGGCVVAACPAAALREVAERLRSRGVRVLTAFELEGGPS